MDAETPKVGDRRPREGRCERCDRPLTDEVWTTWVSREQELRRIWFPASSDETHCVGGISCRESPIDWRARALAAEAALALPSDDYVRGYTNGHAAGRQAAYDGEEPKGYGQALRDMTARAKKAEDREALAVSLWHEAETAARAAAKGEPEPHGMTDVGLDLYWTVRHAIERAEASARQHGLLVGAWCVDALAACVCGDHWTARNRHAPDCAAWMVDEVAALATAAKETP